MIVEIISSTHDDHSGTGEICAFSDNLELALVIINGKFVKLSVNRLKPIVQ